MLPLTAGFLIAGPVSGYLSDKHGQRLFATAGLLVVAAAFTGLMLLPADFPYWAFALIIFGNGVGNGLFASPNTSAIMSSVPARHRGAASGMRSTFQNSGMSLSIGIFGQTAVMVVGSSSHATHRIDAPAGSVPVSLARHSPVAPADRALGPWIRGEAARRTRRCRPRRPGSRARPPR